MSKTKYFHLFCVNCKKGWHFKSIAAVLITEANHITHVRFGAPVPITCGEECANDWEMCKNANV